MFVFGIALYVAIGMYLILLIVFVMGIRRVPLIKQVQELKAGKKISVIVAFRNESENLPGLLDCFLAFQQENIEFVLCNDASGDDSVAQIRKHPLRNVKLIENSLTPGKKGAVLSAIAQSEGDILVFTDADCRMEKNWLRVLTAPLQSDEFAMSAGPVRIIRNSFFSSIQDVDQLSLSASSAAASAFGNPFMCSAANMAVLRKHYPLEEMKNNPLSGGDDVFLLHTLKSQRKAIVFLWQPEVMVRTNAVKNLTAFFSQRIRWAGKSRAYTDIFSLAVAVLVFLVSLNTLIGLLLGLVHPQVLPALLICVSLKAAIDFLFLFLSESRLGERSLWRYYLPAFVFHLLYVPPLAIVAMLYRPLWKGRKIN